MRSSDRSAYEMRAVTLETGVSKHAEGSCLVQFGNTHVLCTASLERQVPGWLRGAGRGWVTAEYAMLPRATGERTRRESSAGRQTGRTQEIQRLIGRSLRSVVDLKALGEWQIIVDCDVLQADGGTRTAAITGGWVALRQCVNWMQARDMVKVDPVREHVAAAACVLLGEDVLVDPDYEEDSRARADANFVMTCSGGIVEVQMTAEGAPFNDEHLFTMLKQARSATAHVIQLQKQAVL